MADWAIGNDVKDKAEAVGENSGWWYLRSPLPAFSYFRDALPTLLFRDLTSWEGDSTIDYLSEPNPFDPVIKFNSLWITLISCFAQKWPVEMSFRGDTFYFFALSTFQSLCFLTFTWVKRLNSPVCFFCFFYTSINTSTWIKNVCMFATSGKLWCKPARASRACDIQYQQLTVSHSTQGCLSEPFACLISLSRMPRDTCFYCLAAHEGNNTKETVRCPLCIRLWNKCWMGP